MVRITNAVESVIEEKAKELLEESKNKLNAKHKRQLKQLKGRWQLYNETKELLEEIGYSVNNDTASPFQSRYWGVNTFVNRLRTHAVAEVNQLPTKATLDEVYSLAEKVMRNLLKKE